MPTTDRLNFEGECLFCKIELQRKAEKKPKMKAVLKILDGTKMGLYLSFTIQFGFAEYLKGSCTHARNCYI